MAGLSKSVAGLFKYVAALFKIGGGLSNWNNCLGNNSLEDIPWKIIPGTYSLGDIPWRIFPGRYSLEDILWGIFPGGYSLEDIPWGIANMHANTCIGGGVYYNALAGMSADCETLLRRGVEEHHRKGLGFRV